MSYSETTTFVGWTNKQHVRPDRTRAEQKLLGSWRGAEGIAEMVSKG